MEVKDRFKQIREIQRLSQTAFAEKIGLSQANITDIERGRGRLRDETISRLYTEFSVNLTWLLTGEGEMFLSSKPKEAEKPSLDALLVTKEELEASPLAPLLKKGGRLPASCIEQEGRKELEETKAELEKLKKLVYRELKIDDGDELNEKAVPYTISQIDLPYVGFAAAAGPLRDFDTIEDTIKVAVNLLPQNREGLFVGRIEGDSMADIIPNGADVLLRACAEPVNGRVYLFSLRGQATIKKYHLDTSGPHFEYMDGSGHSIYPEKGEKWYCNAEFLRVL